MIVRILDDFIVERNRSMGEKIACLVRHESVNKMRKIKRVCWETTRARRCLRSMQDHLTPGEGRQDMDEINYENIDRANTRWRNFTLNRIMKRMEEEKLRFKCERSALNDVYLKKNYFIAYRGQNRTCLINTIYPLQDSCSHSLSMHWHIIGLQSTRINIRHSNSTPE